MGGEGRHEVLLGGSRSREQRKHPHLHLGSPKEGEGLG